MTPPEAPFEAPWQAQAFALAVALHARGAFSWPEWSAALGREIAGGAPHYEAWLAALEGLVRAKGLSDGAELTARRDAWKRAYLSTPHGSPVELAAGALPARH